MKKKKVALIGGSASRKEAPYHDPEWEVWGCNEMDLERVDVMFEMHPMEVQNQRELDWLSECKVPVYVLKATPLVPTGRVYPLKKILKQPWADNYFTCTFAYQIALAIYQGFETIGLWGMNVEMGSPRERTIESACIQWWFGIAKGWGIEVIWPEHPRFFRHRYGYHYMVEMDHVEDWLSRLTIHIIYRLGPRHIYVGGDDLDIRRIKT